MGRFLLTSINNKCIIISIFDIHIPINEKKMEITLLLLTCHTNNDIDNGNSNNNNRYLVDLGYVCMAWGGK